MKNEKFNLKKIGFISKLNGYKGEVVVAGSTTDLTNEKFLFMMMDGIAVPFVVQKIFEKGNNTIVKFEDVNDEEYAKRFVSKEVFIEVKKGSRRKEELIADDYLNFSILDSSFGELGKIIRVEEYPQGQVAVCKVKEKEVLIPLEKDFIDEIDFDSQKIFVSLPEGLIDVYLK